MLRSIRIGSRLAISFSLLLGLLLLVAMVSLANFGRLIKVTQNIVDVQAQRVTLASDANQHAQSAANHLLQLLNTTDRDKRIPIYSAMDADIAALDTAMAGIGSLAGTGMTMESAAEMAQLGRLNTLRNNYDSLFRSSVEALELEGPEQAHEHFDQYTQSALDALLQETSAMSSHQRRGIQADLEQLSGNEANARTLIILLAISALLAGALLAWYVARSISQPVSKAVYVAETIAQGDLNQPVPVEHQDEMGKLLQSLKVMRDSIVSREDKILRLAYEDTLTGLPNRTRFVETLSGMSARGAGAVMLLDINRFALINNALGHPTGDVILQNIGKRLMALTPAPKMIARLWGDKFAFLLENADRNQVNGLVNRVLSALQMPITLSDQRLDVSGSLGVAQYPHDGTDPATLLRRAEMAARFAKQKHLNFAYASDIGNEPPHENLSLIGEMREALERKEFILHYQPKFNFSDGTISGAEALLRWQHPSRGLVAPMGFIPFAEQTGFIRKITPWVLEQVIADAAEWRRNGLTIMPSVNLSTLDLLDPWLIGHIGGLLAKYGLAPQHLCLEITESALMSEPEIALRNLNELSAKGLKLSIDDYGSGQASLAYLKMLPVNELKIDREFVTSVSELPRNAAIVRSTILLCHELGLTVVAEGAETEEELDWLKGNHCDVAQGYGIAKPMPVNEFLGWVSAYPAA